MEASNEQVNTIVDHFFRSEYGKVISYLSSKFGTQHFEGIEDSVQEAIYESTPKSGNFHKKSYFG